MKHLNSAVSAPPLRVPNMDLASDNPVILVVESEALIRLTALQSLEDAGYRVLEASNADEAIAILESRSDIQAVITDINMSGSMDGLKLAHAVRGRWPPIHLIVTSGRNMPNTVELPANTRFISKPYENCQLIAALKEVLGAP
jgi:CheY-like chemotaxis protein